MSVVAKINESYGFSDEIWGEIVERMSVFLNLSKKDRKALQQGKIARLIAALPYLAGCTHPGRLATAHLLVYLFAGHGAGKAVYQFDDSDNDSIFRRLNVINTFGDGNRAIIERGMNLLALSLLSNYERDADRDKASGKPNPVVSGTWNVNELKSSLLKNIEKVECSAMDAILTMEEGVQEWWMTKLMLN